MLRKLTKIEDATFLYRHLFGIFCTVTWIWRTHLEELEKIKLRLTLEQGVMQEPAELGQSVLSNQVCQSDDDYEVSKHLSGVRTDDR